MIDIIKAIKDLGLSSFLSYTIFIWLLFYIIDSPVMKHVEKLCGHTNRVYWYDIIILSFWILLYCYGLYAYGKYLVK